MLFINANILLYFFLLLLGLSGFYFVVIWPNNLGFYVFIIFLALGGLGVAFYIYYTKKFQKHLVCPVGSDCNVVVNSRYSKFLGLNLEYWGIFYYSVIIISYSSLIFFPNFFLKIFPFFLISFSFAAFLFSLYLLFVQGFLLKQWCIWCLLSSLFSILIFVLSLSGLSFTLFFLREITNLINALHNLGFVLGMGGATTSMILFIKFLLDFEISSAELQILKGVSEIVWFGLIITLVSHFAIYVVYPEILVQSGLFLTQTIALIVVLVGGAVLMIIFAPLLIVIPFMEREEKKTRSPFDSLRKYFFVVASISLVSWYFAFFLNYLPEYRFKDILFVYFIVLFVAIIAALFLEKNIIKRS